MWKPFDTTNLKLQTLQAAGAGAEYIAPTTDVTREQRTYKTGDSGGVKENIGKEQEQKATNKAATLRTGDKTIIPDKEVCIFETLKYGNSKVITLKRIN